MKNKFNQNNPTPKKKGKSNYNVGTQTVYMKGDGYKTGKPPKKWWIQKAKKGK